MLVDTAAMRLTARLTVVRGRHGRIRITASGSTHQIGALTHDAPIVDQQQDSLHRIPTLCGVREVLAVEVRRLPEQRTLPFDLEVVRVQ